MERNWLEEKLTEREQVLWRGEGNRRSENIKYYLLSSLVVISSVLLPAALMGKTIIRGIKNNDMDSGIMMAVLLAAVALTGIAKITKQAWIRRKETLEFAVTNKNVYRYTGHGTPDVLPLGEMGTLKLRTRKNGSMYIELDDFCISGVEHTKAVYDLIKRQLTADRRESEEKKNHSGKRIPANMVIDPWMKKRLRPGEVVMWRGETCRSKSREKMKHISLVFMLLVCAMPLVSVFILMSIDVEDGGALAAMGLFSLGMVLYGVYNLYRDTEVNTGDICQYVITNKRVYRYHNGWVKTRDIDQIWHPFLKEEEGRSGTIKLDRNFYMEHIPDAKRVQRLLIKLSETCEEE